MQVLVGAPHARLTHVRCAYGGTGVSPAGYCAVMPYFDVTAGSAVTGLRVTVLEILDTPTGAILARAVAPIELRVSLPGRDADHNEITAPFDGVVDAGGSLRLRAVVEFFDLAPYASNARGYRATLVTDASDVSVVEGPMDAPCGAAGPAGVR